MEVFNSTQDEIDKILQGVKKNKSSIHASDGEFVAKKCVYFKEYCVFVETLENCKNKNKIPKGMEGFIFSGSSSRNNGIYEASQIGARLYQKENREFNAVKNKIVKEYKNKINEIENSKLKNKSVKINKLESEMSDKLDELKKYRKEKSPCYKPRNWDKLLHFKEYNDLVKFLETLGYKFN